MQNITTYFLKHPVISLIFNITILFIGGLSFNALSLREYPESSFPMIEITTIYPNASPELVENSITNILEDNLAGVEGVDRIESFSSQSRSYITMFFKQNVNITKILMDVREAVGNVTLPIGVNSPIIGQKKSSSGLPFILISIESLFMDFADLTHYSILNIVNAFRSLKGVSSVEVWGLPYVYNITLDARKMYAFKVNADEVYSALQRNNVSLPVGKFQNKIPVTLNSEFQNVKDFERVVVKEKSILSGSTTNAILLKQIADIKLETDTTEFRMSMNGRPGLALSIHKGNDANPLAVSSLVKEQLEDIKQNFPDGITAKIVLDSADFIRSSLKNIKFSIFEAIIFVLIVVFIFLGNYKATMIPLITIPISLIGSCLFLKMFGFSINILTLLGMVMAVGLVVDDAIVVLENIQRHIDKGDNPFIAALRGGKEIGFAIVAMTLTLASVYMPLVFIEGNMGKLFTEFAVALAGSVFISGVVALTLSPLMCARILKQKHNHVWPKINNLFINFSEFYKNILQKIIDHKKMCFCIMSSLIVLIIIFTQIIPSEISPKEDRNLVGAYVPIIPGQDIDAMAKKMEEVIQVIKNIPNPEFQDIIMFLGHWGGSVVLPLKPQSERSHTPNEIKQQIESLVKNIPSYDVWAWNLDTGLPGIGTNQRGGDLSLVISTIGSYRELFNKVEQVQKLLNKEKFFSNVKHNLNLDSLSYKINVNTTEMDYLNLNSRQIARTVEIFFSGNKSLTFKKDGLLYPFRISGKHSVWDLNKLYITNKFGKRISLGAVAEIVPEPAPETLYHHNQVRSVILNVDLPKHAKFNQSMVHLLDSVQKELPLTYKTSWLGKAKSFKQSKFTMQILFLLAIVFIFIILVVQFENFIDPFIILLTVPLACAGALSFMWVLGGTINIYTQVGLITLVGLITKHGILIVEFTNQLREKKPLKLAVIEASLLRLRPILMTTSAMVFGSLPLLFSYDAGHETRHAIGVVLVGGLIIGTFFTLFILPTVCLVIKSWQDKFTINSKNITE